MRSTKLFTALIVVLALMLGVIGMASAQDGVSGDLEIFSWWTGGGEA
ncbi:MAG: carbohydrate ABC transporter substrate-binding protein, partial [Burkholderiales bacterium]|nr:carbohydrate ABC transporter substrate-binding protein [Anaerolineae bacterium]